MVMDQYEPEIGYILKGYPRTSETFIANEIFLLERAGKRLTLFSLKRLEGEREHRVFSEIEAPVVYLPETTPSDEGGLFTWLWKNVPGFSASHRKLFRLNPASYLSTLLEAVMMSFKYRGGVLPALNRSFIKEFLQAGFIALETLKSGRIRHLHAHFCHTSTTVTMMASRMCGVPFSFTAHAKDIYRRDLNPHDLLSVKLRRAKFAVTCTMANKDHLDRLGHRSTPLYTIYHGLDITRFTPSPERELMAGQRRNQLILSVGRLVEKKGFTYLVEACSLLKDRGYDFECHIVGGATPYEETISSLIERLGMQETIILHPPVTQEELLEIYDAATIFALPCQVADDGDRDGIPNVLVEAMAMKLPVVSTNISGIPELIEHGMNGLLVPQKNSGALAAAIEQLLDHPELRSQLGQAARVTVCRHFDSRRNIQALNELFEL